MIALRLLAVLFILPFNMVFSWNQESEFYSLSATDIASMENIEMGKYKGKVVMIVNVASECGFTDQHYRQLVDLQRSFDMAQFEILAFPCNQFDKQEPKNNKFIRKFADENYNVNFQMFGKVKTIGQYAHPIYRWLKEESNIEPNWNFNKYLVDKRGRLVRYASPYITPLEMMDDIKMLIADNQLEGGIMAYERRHEEL